MAKEEKDDKKPKAKEGEHGKEGGGKKKKLHLHEIRSTQAHDGSIVHHHTYKDHAEAPFTHPERGPVATSSSPEDAGQHVAEQFAMNQGGAAAPPGGEEPGEEEAGGGQGAPAGPAGGAPEMG
jgi:hypothetical protein